MYIYILITIYIYISLPVLYLVWDSDLTYITVVPSDGVFTRRHTAECAFCTVFYSVFCFSTMLPWGGAEGGGQEQLFLRVMFSAFIHLHWFLQCFSPFRTFFLAPFAFSLGFYSVFRLHDVADATLHIGVGWGGAITFM